MRCRLLNIVLIFILSSKSFSQQWLISTGLIARLDSITLAGSKASHFAELYLQTTISAEEYIQTLPPEEGEMMKKLEQGFAEYFFHANDASYSGNEMPVEWKNYFNDTRLSSLQLKLIGANAHINRDMAGFGKQFFIRGNKKAETIL